MVGGLIVLPKEDAVGTAAILDFLSCNHHHKGAKPFQKGDSEGNEPKCVGSFLIAHFICYSSFSMKILGDESA